MNNEENDFSSKEIFGLNMLLFDYDEIISILKDDNHELHKYVENWFGPLDEDFKDSEGNYEIAFSEDCIEVDPDDLWLVHYKKDYATVVHGIKSIKESIFKLSTYVGGE